MLVRLEGVDSPEAARALSGRLLAVERERALPPRPDGSFYPWQLEGAAVETRDGRPVGRFVRVDGLAARRTLWVIEQDGRERLMPGGAGDRGGRERGGSPHRDRARRRGC